MFDQNDAGARGNMGVVRDVNQQLIAVLVFDPTVKYGDERFEVHFFRILDEELHIHMLEVHFLSLLASNQSKSSECWR
jgi:hypothetical protein